MSAWPTAGLLGCVLYLLVFSMQLILAEMSTGVYLTLAKTLLDLLFYFLKSPPSPFIIFALLLFYFFSSPKLSSGVSNSSPPPAHSTVRAMCFYRVEKTTALSPLSSLVNSSLIGVLLIA